MSLTIYLENEVPDLVSEEENAEIEQLIETVLQRASELEDEAGEVSVTLVDNEMIHQLNLQYRQVDRPTDVLSFALDEEGEGELDIIYEEDELEENGEIPRLLGDIIISIPKAKEQAEEYGHSFHRELAFLAVHGFLHLIGYDHEVEAAAQAMFARQEEILQSCNITR
ncbi:rRNA maturation RNase YbeY [Rubeoparvulum massiliense]|uniref:rRNA maturation RNase YbeY n=1 Tax=Rubeoparvulum massiliense TaxID=1631346 RepID=UPI00065E4464|nr:rRNA maturation RNase YbeY [Rubeoparvulum massiliense]